MEEGTAQVDNGSSDACGIASMTLSKTIFTCEDIGPNQVTLTVIDNNANSNTCSTTIVVIDDIPPTITCFNQTVQFNGQSVIDLQAVDLADASDNCSISSLVTDPVSLSCTQIVQTISVIVTSIDAAGLTSSCTSLVTVTGLPCGWSEDPDGVVPTATT